MTIDWIMMVMISLTLALALASEEGSARRWLKILWRRRPQRKAWPPRWKDLF